GVNWRTVWLPSSVAQMVPSSATEIPWVRYVNSPSPHERRKLPFSSYAMIGWSPRQIRNTRSSPSTATPATSRCSKPFGSCSHPSTTSYLMSASSAILLPVPCTLVADRIPWRRAGGAHVSRSALAPPSAEAERRRRDDLARSRHDRRVPRARANTGSAGRPAHERHDRFPCAHRAGQLRSHGERRGGGAPRPPTPAHTH